MTKRGRKIIGIMLCMAIFLEGCANAKQTEELSSKQLNLVQKVDEFHKNTGIAEEDEKTFEAVKSELKTQITIQTDTDTRVQGAEVFFKSSPEEAMRNTYTFDVAGEVQFSYRVEGIEKDGDFSFLMYSNDSESTLVKREASAQEILSKGLYVIEICYKNTSLYVSFEL